MEDIFEQTKWRYINSKGLDKYERLYRKIQGSNALVKLSGLSVQKGMPPTAQDFLYVISLMPSIYFTMSNAESSMGALIALKLYNENVNSAYHMISDYQLADIARRIAAKWIHI